MESFNKATGTDKINVEHRMLPHFRYEHLPERLQKISKPFHDLAQQIVNEAGGNDPAEITAGLRKLLEAKDCVVRAHV